MTILAPVEKAGTMDKLTDPVTSDSELEEGEIANDEIEIISEFIRHPPIKSQKSSPRKSIPGSNSISSRKLDSFAHRLKHSGSNSSGGGNIDLKHVSESKPVPKTSREKPSISSKRKSPARTPKRLGQSRSSSKTDTSRSSRTRLNSTRSSRGRQSSNQAKKEEKLINSVTFESEESKEKKWKQSFEELLVTPGSVESIGDDSGSEGDEELKLRIEALNSVVVNAKPKDVSNDVVSSKSDSTPEPVISNGVQEEEEADDEDEELLRAQLLIEVARKQTKELEVQMQPEEKDTKAEEPAVPNLAFERRNQATKIPSKSVHIPKADRLVIDLRNDSSDSSDEDDGVQSSITALLKSARQTVEEKSSIVPHALSHLPRNQQEEYQRLKQEIVRRENRLMKQGAPKNSPVIQSQSDGLSKMDSTSGASTQLLLQQPVVISTNSEKSVNTVPPQVDLVPSKDQEMLICSPINTLDSTIPSPIVLPHSASPGSHAKESEKSESIAAVNSGKSDGASVTRPQPTTSTRPVDCLKKISPMKSNESNSPKIIALKQQLLHKKRDLASTKEALKCQLVLVDKHRSLWLNSSQEVNRLRALLQAAEGTERQLRTQLTNSQLQTQRLKTKMQSVERQVTVLHSGIGAHRTRRMSAKLRPKLTNQHGLNSSTTSFTLPSITPLRVKPRVFAKALAKTNNLTYHRPLTTAVDSEVSMSVKGSVQIKAKQNFSGVLEGNKALHDEQWLYGTLGDDWSQSNVVSDFPKWSPHGHASRFLNEGFRVDSSLVVCRYQLDSTPCQIVPCPFQHLPQKDVRQLEKSSPMVSKSTARLATLALLQLTCFDKPGSRRVYTHLCLPLQ